jgi:hypothetical protein
LPVLLVDGDTRPGPSPPERGTDFLGKALAPQSDPTPVVKARVVAADTFTPALLEGKDRPLVLILHNLARLSRPQGEAVGHFLADGGGVLVTLGARAEAEAYNDLLYRGGEGWLPAQLERIVGNETNVKAALRPDPASFTHPALEIFRRDTRGGLADARFPRWWRLTTPGKHAPGVPVGLLRGGTETAPFLVERAVGPGRVMLCAVPLDNSWGTNLPDLAAFVPLAHELVYYLAGARSAEFNLRPGQPIRLRLDADTDLAGFKLQAPSGPPLPLSTRPGESDTHHARVVPQERGALLVFDGARETGVYRLTAPDRGLVYYVVPPDPRESDLTPSTEEDRRKVARIVPVKYDEGEGESETEGASDLQRQEFWLYLLVGLIGLLCVEVWLTRRIVRNRG